MKTKDTQSIAPWGVHWFRRDLRVLGNPALEWSRKRHNGRVLGIFSFDGKFLARSDFSTHRFGFFLETLASLRTDFINRGGELLVLDSGPHGAFEKLIQKIKSSALTLPTTWSWNRDYEPFAIHRDADIERMISSRFGIETHSERDHLLIEPHELFKDKDPGSFYQVYSPFRKKWLSLLASEEIQDRLETQKKLLGSNPRFEQIWSEVTDRAHSLATDFPDALNEYRRKISSQLTVSLPQAGFGPARETIRRFKPSALEAYAQRRDLPAVTGTSRLSIYLKNGSITVPQVISDLELGGITAPLKSVAAPNGRFVYLSELIWREFYYHILAHVPRVETTAFQTKFANIDWEDRPSHLEAWKKGLTGYPIVDAGMRELLQTGWMHNRVRMIVASFLTKDLHVNWQHGEKHFMQLLLDGDLAPNNGGWQWAASTGCDPQPYFRIFNPTLQSTRFDPQGDYIRRFVPELASLSATDIHEPWKNGAASGTGYPKPIVEHRIRAKRAVELYQTAKPEPSLGFT